MQASDWAIPSLAVVLAAGVLGWVSHDEYEDTIRQEYRFLDAHARIAQNQVADLVHDVKQVLTRVVQDPPAVSAAQRPTHARGLVELKREVPEIRTLAILDTQGRIKMAANPSLVGFDGSKREYYTAHRGGPRQFDFHISRPFKTVYGDYSVAFSLPMLDARRRLAGVAVASVSYASFDNVLKDIRPAQSSSAVALVNADGDFLYHQPNPEATVGKNGAGNESFQAFLRSGRNTSYGRAISQSDGRERLYVHRHIPDTALSISISRPIDEVLATWRRNLMLRLALFVLGAALILRLTWTVRRRHREAAASKEFTDRLIDTANAMMIGVDAASRVIAVNEATERITGYQREELIGRSFFDTVMPRNRFPKAWEAFLRYRETGDVPRALEAPILTRDGEVRLIAWQNSRIFAHDDTLAVLSFGVDVTERMQLVQARNREEVSRRLVGIQEEERRRLAVELHDRTSPNLTVLDMNLKQLADGLPPGAPAELIQLIDDTSATLRDTISSIRSVSFDFRPPLLDYAGLWPTLNAYARQFHRRTGIAVQIEGQEPTPKLPPDIETNLFRIAQEALANCAQHSFAERVSVCESIQGNEIVLSIGDDGVGFDAATTKGHGLAMMRQRAEFIGGTLDLDTRPGEGTRIVVRFSAVAAAASPQAWRADQAAASQAPTPSAAARPLAMHAVSR